jgi:CubicO group peptidase (beta-lactamase class C family)
MNRRDFLLESSNAALGASAVCISGFSRAQPGHRSTDAFFDALVGKWEAEIPTWLTAAKMPAVSIAIIREGEVAWQRAFGVKDTGTREPVDPDTVFAACSNTKPVFAYGVMKLCERGVLDLDTPLTKYTSRRVSADPRIELITTRHVLNHTTGFPNWRQGSDLPIQFTPGARKQYSGEGFSYLQSVVVEIAGKSFEEFMVDNILTPLGMQASSISAGLDYADLAKPHDENGTRLPGKYYTRPSAADEAEGIARYGAAAMLMTTPGDYAKFLLEFLRPSPADEFRLSEASRTEMLRPQVQDRNGVWEGLSWAIEQHDGAPAIFAHSGQDAGYYCVAAGCTERRSGLMIMFNGDAYAPMLWNLLADPSGVPPDSPNNLWPDFVRKFFAA